VRWRESNNASYREREGIGLSYVAAVVKAVTETLRQHPTLNSQFAEDRVILKQAMNIGIAVAVDNGLLVPVIHDADQLSISGVNHRIQDLAARARTNKLKLDEIQGGTFTVNNTGWFGSVSSMPIINAPEVAILSMEAIVKRPVVTTIEGEDVIVIRPMMNMTCSFDHRVLDGAQVGAFMSDVRKRLEEGDPQTPIGCSSAVGVAPATAPRRLRAPQPPHRRNPDQGAAGLEADEQQDQEADAADGGSRHGPGLEAGEQVEVTEAKPEIEAVARWQAEHGRRQDPARRLTAGVATERW
jgi:hypothetical protein